MNNYNLLKKLCITSGISGNEKNIQNIIVAEIEKYCEKIEIDSLGNVIAFKKGKSTPKNKVMLSAHMDEVGLIVTNINNDGFINFDVVGGIDEKILPGKLVHIGKKNIPGVIGVKPVHLEETSTKHDTVKIKDMYIDIGANSKKEALENVNFGDSVCFDGNFEIKNNFIQTKALDDRAGCYILTNLIKKDLDFDTYFTFVVQEEIGLRGATTTAYNVDPDFAIIIEATTANDIPGVPAENVVCKIDNGAVVSFMDKSTIYDKKLCDLSFEVAKKHNLKIQPKKSIVGGNDAGAIHKTKSGVRTLALSVPCRYLHTGNSLISTNDLKNVEKLAEKLISEIAIL